MARIGLFTDLHFADGVREGTRFCSLGLQKLRLALSDFAEANVDLVIGLGDLVDSADTIEQEAGYLEQVCAVLQESGIPVWLIPGNHCVWTLDKQQFLQVTGQASSWGKVELGGWRLLLLDGCFRNDGVSYGARNNDWRDALVSEEQVRWLGDELAQSRPTLVCIHQRLDCEPPYGVANARQIRQMLEASGCVRAVYQGHEHGGAFSEIGQIPYHTLPAMVEGRDVTRRAWTVVELPGDGGGITTVL